MADCLSKPLPPTNCYFLFQVVFSIHAVCVLHIKQFFLPIDFQHTTSVRADPREIQVLVMWSQNYAREILRTRYAVSKGENAILCQHTGCDRHDIHIR